ncbi:hypothetical protein MHU86_22371 [Fragilaria crotonensis]|nr:hypothetical protein MHU86_22371 [Fragilaria crotonensis]
MAESKLKTEGGKQDKDKEAGGDKKKTFNFHKGQNCMQLPTTKFEGKVLLSRDTTMTGPTLSNQICSPEPQRRLPGMLVEPISVAATLRRLSKVKRYQYLQ